MEDIAIVGMSCLFPGAGDTRAFWQNVVGAVDAITEAPADWWPDRYGRDAAIASGEGKPNDRVYTTKGGFLGPLSRFKAARYGVMPSSVDGAEPDHFLALRCAFEALADAGIPDRPLHRKRTGVILARGLYVNRGTLSWVSHGWAVDQVMAVIARLHPELDGDTLAAIKGDVKAALPPFNAEIVPGLVNSVMCGRIANRLDLMGPAYTIDAACASTLIAVENGMRELSSGRCDAVLVGGVQVSTPGPIHLLFSNLDAASHSGRIAPFGAQADGTLLGEGCGILLLKRRADAERDGHRIYALLRGVGTASDGRGLGLLAPRFEGQMLALDRAYESSGIDPASIGLIEAHGTATARGDATEVQSLVACFGRRKGERATIALGAVKSMIGHLLPAAGAASIIKTALALHHRVLPPTLHADEPNAALKLEDTPFHLSTRARPWVHGDRSSPRRAGVNAFGFGGINAHAILEEYVGGDERTLERLERCWPVELVVVSAADRAALVERAGSLAVWLEANADLALLDVAAACNRDGGAARLAIVAKDCADLAKKLKQAVKLLGQPDREKIQDRTGVFWYQQPLARTGRIAWLFPGEGAQYVNMLADLARHFPEVRREFDVTDAGFASRAGGKPVSPLIFPLPGEEQKAEEALLGLEGAVGTVIAAERALMALLARLGVPAHAIVGHSSGEFMALEAAGAYVVEGDDARVRAIAYGADVATRIAGQGLAKAAVLTSVGGADPVAVHEVLERSNGRLVVAMDNCPSQLVISGDEDATRDALDGLRGKGGLCERLPWGRAYHTEGFRAACPILAEYYDTVGVGTPQVELWSCATAAKFPREPVAVRELAVRQWHSKVRFRETIEAMHVDGIRVFLEVGPRGNLTNFVSDTLGTRPHAAVALDVRRKNGVEQLCRALAQLVAHGVDVRLEALTANRVPRELALGEPLPRLPEDPPLEFALPELTLTDATVARVQERIGRVAPPMRADGPRQSRVDRGSASTSASSVRPLVRGLMRAGAVAAVPTRPHPIAAATAHATAEAMAVEAGGVAPGDAPISVATGASRPSSGRRRALVDYQETMRLFLDTQERVMQNALGRGRAQDVPRAPAPSIEHERSPARVADTVAEPSPPPRRATAAPLVTRVIEHEPGQRILVECELDSDQLGFLIDHTFFGRELSVRDPSLRGLPIMALAMSEELIAEAALLLHPGQVVKALVEVKTSGWLVFDPPERTIRVEVVSEGEGRARGRVLGGEGAAVPATIVEAVVELGASLPELGAPVVPDQARAPGRIRPEDMYGRMLFHGPAFAGIVSAERCDSKGVAATVVQPDPDLLFVPEAPGVPAIPAALIDTAGHVPGLEILGPWQDEDPTITLIFPNGYRRVEWARLADPRAPLTTISTVGREGTRVLSDVEMREPGGRVVLRVIGRVDETVELPTALYHYGSAPRKPVMTRDVTALFAGVPGIEHALIAEIGTIGSPIIVKHLWQRALAHMILSRAERATFESLKRPPVLLAGWLFGRVVAKDAVRRWGGLDVCMADVEIVNDANGAPRAVLPGARLPALSLAHTGFAAVAAAADPQRFAGVGIDVEPVGTMDVALVNDAFNPSERALLLSAARATGESQDSWLIAAWGAKEAVGKALGSGVKGGPRAVEVVAADGAQGRITVELRGAMAEAFPAWARRKIHAYRRITSTETHSVTLCLLTHEAS